AAVRSGRARRSGRNTARPGTTDVRAAIQRLSARRLGRETRAVVRGRIAEPIAAVLVCGAAKALEAAVGALAEALAVEGVEMARRGAEGAVAAARGGRPACGRRCARAPDTQAAHLDAALVRGARAVAVTRTQVDRGSRARSRTRGVRRRGGGG